MIRLQIVKPTSTIRSRSHCRSLTSSRNSMRKPKNRHRCNRWRHQQKFCPKKRNCLRSMTMMSRRIARIAMSSIMTAAISRTTTIAIRMATAMATGTITVDQCRPNLCHEPVATIQSLRYRLIKVLPWALPPSTMTRLVAYDRSQSRVPLQPATRLPFVLPQNEAHFNLSFLLRVTVAHFVFFYILIEVFLVLFFFPFFSVIVVAVLVYIFTSRLSLGVNVRFWVIYSSAKIIKWIGLVIVVCITTYIYTYLFVFDFRSLVGFCSVFFLHHFIIFGFHFFTCLLVHSHSHVLVFRQLTQKFVAKF